MNSLQRIILIDSYMPGIVELKVNKHTNICGINASGKTTLQRLILVFYGELPSNVVPRTRDSFEKWYLPRHSSYLVFEYYNHQNKLNQVVLSASVDGRSVSYRFIKQSYQLEAFVSRTVNKQHEFYSMQELGRQLKSAKIDSSTQLSSMEYRAIIQHDQTLSKLLSRHQDIRRYTRQYSLCDSQHSLRHVEKLVHAIHTKAGKMNSIKAMIAAILEEDGVQPPSIQLKAINVQNWASKILVVEDLVRRQKEMDDLSHLDSQVNHIELQLCEDKSFLMLAVQACYKEIESTTQQISSLNQTYQSIDESWLNIRDSLSLEISQTGFTIDESERRLEQIETRYTQYIDSDIEKIYQNLTYLDSWQRDLSALKQQYDMLTEQHTDIERTYQNRKASILDNKDKETGLTSKSLNQFQTQYSVLVVKNVNEQRVAEKKHHQEDESLIKKYTDRISDQTGVVNRFESQLEFMGASEQEKQEIALVNIRLEEVDKKRFEAIAEHKISASVEQKEKYALDECMGSYASACKALTQSELLLEQARNRRYPADGSLLHYLRNDNEQWTADIGKVIDSSLLKRCDLKPQSQLSNDSFFGVSVDLQAIDTPLHAQSDEVLRIQMTQADDQLKLDLRSKNEIETKVFVVKQAHEEASKNLLLLQSKVGRIEQQIDEIKNEKTLINSRHQDNLSSRKSAIKQETKSAQQVLVSIHKEYEETLNNAKETFVEYFRELIAMHSDTENEIKYRIETADKRLIEIKTDADKLLKEALQFYQATLAERGVDEKVIKDCEHRIKDLDAAITETMHRRKEALEFIDWKQTHINQLKPDLLKSVKHKKLLLGDLNNQLSAKKADYKTQIKVVKRELSTCNKVKEQLNNNSKDIERILQTLTSLNLKPVSNQPIEESIIDIIFDALKEQADSVELRINETNRVRGKLKEHIQHFDSLINKSGASELSEAWEKAREQATQGDVLNPDPHQLVAELQMIFNNLLPQLSKSLTDEGRGYCIAIKSYYDVLFNIDIKISAQAAKITRHIGEELDLDGVSESAVRINSTVSKLNFWDNLNAFNRYYNTWRETGFSVQPEQALIESMQEVAAILSRNKDNKISIIDVLNIELRLKEGESHLVIRTDQELVDSSSQGMAYLILCKFLLAFTRMLRGNSNTVVHWPIDELGTLHVSYIKKVFDACERNHITIVGAFPNSDTSFLKLFHNRYIMDRSTRQLTSIRSNPSRLEKKLAEHIQQLADKQVTI
ncbi:MAG: ATP-binding protein [Methylococcaceae bacterium]